MKLDYPRYSDGIKSVVQNAFGGFNRQCSAADGEIYDMLNMTCDHYPVLSTSSPRGINENITASEELTLVGVCDVADRIIVIGEQAPPADGTYELYAEYVTDSGENVRKYIPFSGRHTSYQGYIRAVSFNRRLAVFCSGEMCMIEITKDDEGYDQLNCERIDRVYDGESNSYKDDDYTYISINNYAGNFVPGDTLSVYDTRAQTEHYMTLIDAVDEDNNITTLTFDLNENIFYPNSGEYGDYYVISRKVPPLEHVCVNRDRIWGTVGNEIYSCASGDMRNWYNYEATAAASFQAEIYAVSRFVGCASYGSNVYFFTTEDVYRMYGTTPTAFSLVTLGTYGCEEMSGESFGVTSHRLFYNSTHGPVVFDGDTASLISRPFGDERITDVRGIAWGGKYYMATADRLYVYDTRYGAWTAEDMRGIVGMLVLSGRLMMLSDEGALYIDALPGEKVAQVADSYVEFADISEGTMFGVNVSEFALRVWLGEGAKLKLSISCDGDPYREIWSTGREGRRTYTVRYSPMTRCESYRLRLDGEGEWKLYSLMRNYTATTNQRYGG